MTGATKVTTRKKARTIRILVVENGGDIAEQLRQAGSEGIRCDLATADSLMIARNRLAREKFDLVLCQHVLADGSASDLVPSLHSRQWDSSLLVMAEHPSAEEVLTAFRSGAADFLCLPLDTTLLLQRIRRTLQNRVIASRSTDRISRLRNALRRMNQSRKLISQRVDVLCSDLVAAYGQLAQDLDTVRNQEDYRQTISTMVDLEQLICCTMDWLLKKLGHANVGIWLRGASGDFELGAYMRHTIAASKPLLKAMRAGIVQKTVAGPMLIRGDASSAPELTPDEQRLLAGQSMACVSTTFLGEAIAVLILFRDEGTPFTDAHLAQLKQITPLLGNALSRLMSPPKPKQEKMPPETDETKPPEEQDKADWWKRGDAPPF